MSPQQHIIGMIATIALAGSALFAPKSHGDHQTETSTLATLQAAPSSARRVSQVRLEVRQLQAHSQDACDGRMDFYAQLRVDAGGTRQQRQFAQIQGNQITPGWQITSQLRGATRIAFVEVEVRDKDSFFCGGRDDVVDINPDPHNHTLRLAVNIRSRQVLRQQGLQWIQIGQIGQAIRLQGTHGRETGAIDLLFHLETQQPAAVEKNPSMILPRAHHAESLWRRSELAGRSSVGSVSIPS